MNELLATILEIGAHVLIIGVGVLVSCGIYAVWYGS